MGLDVYLKRGEIVEVDGERTDGRYAESIENDSAKHPEHMFKVGYFRSSYNGGGFNSVVGNLLGGSLYTIFPECEENDYFVKPDWALLQQLRETLERDGGMLSVFMVSKNLFQEGDEGLPHSQEEAMAAFKRVRDKYDSKDPFNSFSCREGEFFLGDEGLHVTGLLPGVAWGGQPCVYVVAKSSQEGDGKSPEDNWYFQALEVVLETIDFVLASGTPDLFYFHWSG